MNLQQLQSDFQRIVLDAECTGADWVSDSAQELSSQQRIGIYHNAYRVRLIDVLLDTFEHTSIYLGDDWFHQLASSYVQTHHSTHANIGLYGQTFPTYLAEQLADDLEVSELALMDWQLRRAFDGKDSTILSQQDLQQMVTEEGDEICLHTVSTLTISTQHFNTVDIWHAIDQEQRPPEPEKLPHPVDILIWRKAHSPHFRSLSSIEATALKLVCDGNTLNDVGEALDDAAPDTDTATEFGIMLHRWLNDDILCR